VRPAELNMNPDIIPKAVVGTELRAKEMQTELAIPESFSPAELFEFDDHGSDSMADFSGVRKGILAPNEHNMPSEYSELHSLKVGVVGKHSTQKLRFMFEGASFWLPKKDQAYIMENVFGKEDHVLCELRWSAGALGFRISERSDTSATMASGSTTLMLPAEQPAVKPPTFTGKRIAAKNLRASTEGYEIMDAFLINIKGKTDSCVVDTTEGLLALPSSFSKWVIAEAEHKKQPKDVSFLRGCKVVKPPGGTLIGVSGNPNAEPVMWIITAAGRDLVRQNETTTSVTAREKAAERTARENEAEGAASSQADGGEPRKKIQKT